MITKRIELPKKFVKYLVTLPENGMGFQIVKVILKNGNVINNLKVFNSSVLLVKNDKILKDCDIEKIELK